MEFTNISVGDNKSIPDEIKIKSRAIITDSDGKILVGNYGGVYLLPGGSMDKDENPDETIIRELSEEAGLKFEKLDPFIKMEIFQNNYPTRSGKTINRLIINYYYIGKEADASKHKVHLTDKEIKDKFSLKYYSIHEIEEILDADNFENPRGKYFNEELRIIIDEYKKYKNNEIKRIFKIM